MPESEPLRRLLPADDYRTWQWIAALWRPVPRGVDYRRAVEARIAAAGDIPKRG